MTATDWTQIGKSLLVQNLCLYDKLNLPLGGRDERATLFACCPYAGPIATATPAKSSPNSWDVAIFIQNGSKIASLTASAVFRLFWSKCQKLILVQTNGRVLFYDPLGKLLNTFSMGDETLAVGLLDVKQFSYANETGLAILNNAGHCFAVNSVNTTLLWRIQDVNRELPSSILANFCCWTVLANPPKQTQVLLCAKTKFVRGIQESPAGFQQCNFSWARRDGQYLAMETNQKNSQLLLLHDAKLIQLIGIGGDNDDFHLLLRQILIKEQLAGIIKLFWCTETAFALEDESEPGQLSLYALDGNEDGKLSEDIAQQQREETISENNFTFSFSAPAHYFAEIDGIRVFTRHSAHLIIPLAKATKFVFGVGSEQPGANLYEAAKNLEANNHMAYEYIRSINAQMMEIAIDDCLAAAGNHFDPKMQKLLLKAASMGMRRTVRPYDADKFIRIARLLRTLNALRLLGIPLTFGQLQELSPGSLLDRLVALGHWPLAIQLCKFLRLDTKGGIFKILAHWCMAMIREYKQQQTMGAGGGGGRIEELSKRIIAQMKQYSGIGYADIAEMASRQELPELATILLELETDVGRQVTVMLKLKRLEKALQRAAQSQQPDLMGLVLRHLRNSLNGREMELLLRKVPQALSIYQSEIRDEAPDRLLALYDQNDDFIRQAILYLQRADQCQDIFDASKRMEQLAKGEKALRNMKDTANGQLVAESLQLISENIKREEKFAASLSHMSVRETFQWAAAHDELALMEQLKKQHRLADKQVFLWAVEGFAHGKKWQQLEQYLQSRKSPVGYLPVFEICASMGNKNLPLRLMDRVTDYEEKVAAYLTLGEPGKAAKLAAEKTDLQMLQMIRRKYPTTSTQWEEVSKIMESIAQPR